MLPVTLVAAEIRPQGTHSITCCVQRVRDFFRPGVLSTGRRPQGKSSCTNRAPLMIIETFLSMCLITACDCHACTFSWQTIDLSFIVTLQSFMHDIQGCALCTFGNQLAIVITMSQICLASMQMVKSALSYVPCCTKAISIEFAPDEKSHLCR